MALLKADDISGFTELMHPDATKRFRGWMVELLDVAEANGQSQELMLLYAGYDTPEELSPLTDAEFMASMLSGVFRAQGLLGIMANAEIDIVGSVPEDDVRHVVYRFTTDVDGMSISKLTVMSLAPSEEGWRMLLTGDMEGMAAALQRAMGVDPQN
ncbi:MAG: hypothetical protein AAGI54_07600 [Planctomycetota bacterium]